MLIVGLVLEPQHVNFQCYRAPAFSVRLMAKEGETPFSSTCCFHVSAIVHVSK